MPKSKQTALTSQGPAMLVKSLKQMAKGLSAIEADIPSSKKDKTTKKPGLILITLRPQSRSHLISLSNFQNHTLRQ